MENMNQSLEAIYTYHQTTKHRYERFALGPAYMDWNNQIALQEIEA